MKGMIGETIITCPAGCPAEIAGSCKEKTFGNVFGAKNWGVSGLHVLDSAAVLLFY